MVMLRLRAQRDGRQGKRIEGGTENDVGPSRLCRIKTARTRQMDRLLRSGARLGRTAVAVAGGSGWMARGRPREMKNWARSKAQNVIDRGFNTNSGYVIP
jgi:hypothetical protein